MKRLSFTTKIKASREKIWEILWNDKTYREWTGVFGEGSCAVSDWKEGSKGYGPTGRSVMHWS